MTKGYGNFLDLLLLQSGDVESNPGPPRRNPAAPPKKEPPKEEKEETLTAKVKEYEEKIVRLEKTADSQKQEIDNLKNMMKNLEGTVIEIFKQQGVEEKLIHMNAKIDAITGVYDDLHEKMHEIDKTRKNNLLFYGIKPDFLPEIPSQLEQKVHEIVKVNLGISREVVLTKISRMISGPEVRGCRPVLVNFVNWKDREEVLRKANFLKGSNVFVTEDLSRKVREHRQELHKYARQIRSKSPNKKCILRQDKLFIDNQMYVYDEDRNEVVRHTRPASPPRAPSRNYSGVDNSLRRSTSVHSVNGEAYGERNGDQGHSPRLMAPGSASSIGGHIPSNMGGQMKFASTESLHLGTQEPNGSQYQQQQHQDLDPSFTLSIPNGPKIQTTIPEVTEEESLSMEEKPVNNSRPNKQLSRSESVVTKEGSKRGKTPTPPQNKDVNKKDSVKVQQGKKGKTDENSPESEREVKEKNETGAEKKSDEDDKGHHGSKDDQSGKPSTPKEDKTETKNPSSSQANSDKKSKELEQQSKSLQDGKTVKTVKIKEDPEKTEKLEPPKIEAN